MSLEDQEMLVTIMCKRIVEGKRGKIRASYLAALDERLQAQIRSGSVGDLFESLEDD